MELKMELNVSNDKTARGNNVQDIKDFNSESLATQAKEREQLVSKMPSIEKHLI